MPTLARIWFFLLAGGVVLLVGGVWGAWLGLSEPEPTVLTWAQFVKNEPDKKWFRIEDAPFVDARTVRIIRSKRIGTAEDAYVPVVEDPAAPTGPVLVFLHVAEDLELAPPVVAGATPTVRRGPLEGWRIELSDDTRSLLTRQGAPVAPNMTVLRAGGAKPLWLCGLLAAGGGLLLLLGWKALRYRNRAREGAASPSERSSFAAPDGSVADGVLEEQGEYDRATIEALAKAGSDLSKPHLVEHHFVCPDPTRAAAAVEWGRAHGYRPSPVTTANFKGSDYAYFDLVKSTVPSLERISSDTKAMIDLAARSGIEYDGWGCSVVK
jgi:regulator of ribonuclease activity B